MAMARKRGNPNWGRPLQSIRALPTEFEQQVQRLGLTIQTCADSDTLRYWCKRNCTRCYVPEWLLRAWRIDVNATFSETQRQRNGLPRGAARRPID